MLRHACQALADEMHKHAIVSVSTTKPGDDALPWEIGTEIHRFSVFVEADGVKARTMADEIEQARCAGFAEGAAFVADAAWGKISHWGSHYSVASVRKDDASRFISEALQEAHASNVPALAAATAKSV
jgi:hypothetical protein